MDGRVPRCASHQCPVANPNRVEDSRRGFAQSGGGRASFVFQLLSPTCGVSYNKAHTLRIHYGTPRAIPMRSLSAALTHMSYADLRKVRICRITINSPHFAHRVRHRGLIETGSVGSPRFSRAKTPAKPPERCEKCPQNRVRITAVA